MKPKNQVIRIALILFGLLAFTIHGAEITKKDKSTVKPGRKVDCFCKDENNGIERNRRMLSVCLNRFNSEVISSGKPEHIQYLRDQCLQVQLTLIKKKSDYLQTGCNPVKCTEEVSYEKSDLNKTLESHLFRSPSLVTALQNDLENDFKQISRACVFKKIK